MCAKYSNPLLCTSVGHMWVGFKGHGLLLCSCSSEETSKQPRILVSCLPSLVLPEYSHDVCVWFPTAAWKSTHVAVHGTNYL